MLDGMCRGAYDEAYVTALGPSTGCTAACKEFKGADRCGGDFAISLFRLTGMQYDTGAGEIQQWHGPAALVSWQCIAELAVVDLSSLQVTTMIACAGPNIAHVTVLQSA